jgi:hypothetical protein
MRSRVGWFVALLLGLCLLSGTAACGDADDQSGGQNQAGGGGPEEEAGTPNTESGGGGGPDEEDGNDGGLGGPLEEPGNPAPPAEPTSVCSAIQYADEAALAAFDDLAGRPADEQTQEARDDVAARFDAARAEVSGQLGLAPAGPVLDAGRQVAAEQAAVHDALVAGDPVDLDGLENAHAALQVACEAG